MSEAASAPAPAEKKEGSDSLADVQKALELMAQGKRNILCGEVPYAVNQFQEASQLLAKKYGETANECGDSYLCYGKALLDMSRMESGVLGNALQGMDEEDEESEEKSSESSDDKSEDPEKITEEEREKISIDVYDAMAEREEERKAREEKEKKPKKEVGEEEPMEDGEKKEEKKDDNEEEKKEEKVCKKETPKEEAKDEKMETGEGESKKDDEGTEAESEDLNTEEEEGGETEEGEEAEGSAAEGEEAEGEKGEKKEDEEKEEKEEEDVSNLQLAWEMLELSKIIFKRDQTKEARLKLAESHLKLGEVALETEQYDSAVGDFKECLKIQKDLLDAEDRCMAETHYQLGLAHTFACQYDDAISNYKRAASAIEAKIKTLEKVIEEGEKQGKGKDIVDFEDPVYKAHKEIKELREILPDMLAKVEDVLEEQKTADEAKQMVKEAVGLGDNIGASTSAAPTSEDDKPANVITHLVRKKRKNEENTADDTKKSKVENGSGDASVNGTTSPEKQEEAKTKTVEAVKESTDTAQTSS